MSTNLRETLRERVDELKTLRDQIRVDLNLAALELRDEWRELEKRIPDASRFADEIKSATLEAVDKVLTDARRFRARMVASPPSGNTIAGLMSREIVTCTPQTSLAEAARLMWRHDVGCLPVLDDGRVVGMVTDRDACMAAYLEGRRLDQIEVRTAMSRDLHSCAPEATPGDAEAIMAQHQIRRLPVLDDNGHLVGIVTLADLARGTNFRKDAGGGDGVTTQAMTKTYAAIVAPRAGAVAGSGS